MPENPNALTIDNSALILIDHQLGTRDGGRPWSSSGRAVDDAEQRADGELEAHVEPTLQVLPGPLVHADLAAVAALAAGARAMRRVGGRCQTR